MTQPPADPRLNLSRFDRLALEIGWVAWDHARMDVGLRHVYAVIVGPSPARLLTNDIRSTKRLIDDVRLMLEQSAIIIDEDLMAAAMDTLAAATAANTARNQVVHDMWIPILTAGSPPERWRILRRVRGQVGPVEMNDPRDLSYAQQVHDQLRRVVKRLDALAWVLQDVVPIYEASDLFPDPRHYPNLLPMFTAILHDHFDLTEPDGVRLRPPPHPPE
jgi:hypothetical protein